ncbi:response regulator [Flavobacterium sp. GT3R68]|uniref:response regulator n=1 Tax=Flavobacterium sp. GT3R68 TaxID=2594437 RepID=UPI000F85EF2B|nr:response regulator [Flavobacterium sp. GT3R68]RTY95138.1 response regulator [Flavobacterium sp. GSN2]TRW91120.1 response regulator [Flavobacterium sp. GT3R68]
MTDGLKSKFERVMIIDDSIPDLYISSRMITKNNFAKQVLEYSSPKEALIYLKENQESTELLPEIIIVDIYMPLMSGFEFLEEYNKLSTVLQKYSKVFIISSTIDDSDIIRARNYPNVVSFQVKPITREFLNRIQND